MQIKDKYDVLIAGGGLAGLTLALQLKQAKPELSVLQLEKRSEDAPVATHKVGESLSEMGASYLREVLNLKDHLANSQLKKFGFRFFFSPQHRNDISRRVEVGSRISNPYPSHQIDRGLLENELQRRCIDCGVEIVLGARVTDVEISKEGHRICFETESNAKHEQMSDTFEVSRHQYSCEGKWMVDTTGRNGLLKRKLGLKKDINHDINSSWFRLDTKIDIDYWSDDLAWRSFVDPGRRRLATNHLMGKGYWVWIIPLFDDKTSIGIVADPRYHDFNTFNTFEKSLSWLEKHEPLAYNMLDKHRDVQMDFKVMKHFAYDSKQFYSSDRWAVSGEAGAFMDAFYSPGSDFIGLSNSWITDLIIRDMDGENISKRALVYDLAHKELLSGWITLYRDMYGIFGNTQVMMMKIIWDWASYWAIPNVLFMNKGYTNLEVLKQYSSSDTGIGKRFSKLNERMQELFRAWGQQESEAWSDHQFNVFELDCLLKFQSELGLQYPTTELMPKIESNLKILEQIAAEIFRLANTEMHGVAHDMKADDTDIDNNIRSDIAKMWFPAIKKPLSEFA